MGIVVIGFALVLICIGSFVEIEEIRCVLKPVLCITVWKSEVKAGSKDAYLVICGILEGCGSCMFLFILVISTI